MISRHRARRLALQGLYCLDAQGDAAMPMVDLFLEDSQEPPAVIDAARDLLRDAWSDRDGCDRLLARHARHWELSRLAMVDRGILRLAVHELRWAKAPPRVVINEAIKLAQEFSTAESPRFVNGILDAIYREMAEAKPGRDAGKDEAGTDAGRDNSGRDAGDAQDEEK